MKQVLNRQKHVCITKLISINSSLVTHPGCVFMLISLVLLKLKLYFNALKAILFNLFILLNVTRIKILWSSSLFYTSHPERTLSFSPSKISSVFIC